MLVKLMSVFFNILYIWTIAFLALFVLSFHCFLVLSVKQLVNKAYQDGVPWMDDFWLSVPQI